MSVAATTPERFDINRVLRRTAEVVQRNWRSLIRPAVILLYMPGAIVGALQPHRGPFGELAGPQAGAALLSLLALVPYALFQGGMIRLTVADLNAEPISTDEAMAAGRRRIWPLLAVLLLSGLGIMLGLALLIVPGVLLALAWAVTAPVVIEEAPPVMQTFGRSAELTRHNRLSILGAGLALLAAYLVGALAVAVVSSPFPALLSQTLIWPAWTAVVTTVAAALSAVIYDELRHLRREGSETTTASPPPV